MYNMESMIIRIKELKKAQKLSNEMLAGRAGIPLGTLSKILGSETKDPQISNIIKIAQALGVSADYLILGETKKKEPATPKPEVTGEEYDRLYITLYNALIENGWLKDGEDLTDKQLEVLIGIVKILNAVF